MGRMLARFVLFTGVYLVSGCCFGANEELPNISANDNRTPAGHLDSGVLTLHLELREGLWHPEAEDGRAIDVYSFAEEGHAPQTPGPLIRVPRGTELCVSVQNLLSIPAYVYGLHQHPGKAADSLQLAPREIKKVHFAAGEPGSYFYWASTSAGDLEARPLEQGLMSGALIVDPPGGKPTDRIMVIQVRAQHLYDPQFEGILSINGKSWPYTERLDVRLGNPEHWRIVNASPVRHPMHLHGFYFYVDATSDGETEHQFSAAERPMVFTEPVPAGHTFDMTWVPDRTGNWLFHCHILGHMMGDFKSPVLYGPDGPPPMAAHARAEHMEASTGMGELVMGITVSGEEERLIPTKTVVTPPTDEKHLYVRERSARSYVPAGPGFYLEGVSKEIGAIGPPLVLTRGERSAVTIHNELNESTSIHWHGLEIESYYDGVPLWDGTPQHATPYIAPGNSFTAYMTPPHAGTFIYHTHWNDVRQLTGGMYGALLVLEPGHKYDPTSDKVFVLGRRGPNEMHDPLVVNGSPQPGLMVLLTGQNYRFRFINITPNDGHVDIALITEGHPAKWRALAKDAADLPPQRAILRDATQTISVGETYDFEFAPTEPGDYELRFCSSLGSEVTQMIAVVLTGSRFSVYAAKR